MTMNMMYRCHHHRPSDIRRKAPMLRLATSIELALLLIAPSARARISSSSARLCWNSKEPSLSFWACCTNNDVRSACIESWCSSCFSEDMSAGANPGFSGLEPCAKSSSAREVDCPFDGEMFATALGGCVFLALSPSLVAAGKDDVEGPLECVAFCTVDSGAKYSSRRSSSLGSNPASSSSRRFSSYSRSVKRLINWRCLASSLCWLCFRCWVFTFCVLCSRRSSRVRACSTFWQ